MKTSIRTKSVILLACFLSTNCYGGFVGIENADFESHYRAQKEPMWCWASSAEMVLSFQGIKLPQEAIVTHIKGMPINVGGSVIDMVRAVNGVFKTSNGEKVVVSGQHVEGAPLTTVLYNQLKNKKPVILTYRANMFSGHAVVITGADATVTNSGVMITRLHIFDPFCYRGTPPTPILAPNGSIQGWKPGALVQDDSLKAKTCEIGTWGFQVVLPGLGQVTGMILIDGTKE